MKKILIVFAYFTFAFILNATELAFGDTVDKFKLVDIMGNELSFPMENRVTVVYFFNAENPSHPRNFSEINQLILNLPQRNKVMLVGITKGSTEKLKWIINSFKISGFLINDEKENVLNYFNFHCGACTKIIIIDKERKLRYDAGYSDLHFVHSVVERYAQEIK